MQIWNVARSASDIALSMSGPLTGAEPGLAAYYRMTNGSGTSLTDNSGHGWTGTLLDGDSGVPGNGPIAWVTSGAFGGRAPPLPTRLRSRTRRAAVDGRGHAVADDVERLTTRTKIRLTFRVIVAAGPWRARRARPRNSPTCRRRTSSARTASRSSPTTGAPIPRPATVSIDVFPVNDPPVAGNNSAVTAHRHAGLDSVLANDADAEGNLLSISGVTQPPHGTASNEVVNVLYTPAAGFSGTDSFTYTIADGQGGFATATVTVTVTPAGADPGLAAPVRRRRATT